MNPEVAPARDDTEAPGQDGAPAEEGEQQEGAAQDAGSKMLAVIKDLFYSTGKTLYQLYREGCSGDSLDLTSFHQIVSKYSNATLT